MIWKFLLIVFLITYVVYKIASFFFRAGAASQNLRRGEADANVRSNGQNNKKSTKFKGGEYIDYEEVK